MYVLCLLWMCSCHQGSSEKGVLTESPAGMVHADEVAEQASTGNTVMPPKIEEKAKSRARVTTEQSGGLKKFYQEVQKPIQRFAVNSQKDRTLICKEGTKISFKAHSFVTEAGEPVVG